MKRFDKTEFLDKWEKLNRLAFNPAATPGEAQNALSKMRDMLRKNNLNYDEVSLFSRQMAAKHQRPSQPRNIRMPAGKYANLTFEQIYQFDPIHLDMALVAAAHLPQLQRDILDFLQRKRNVAYANPQ